MKKPKLKQKTVVKVRIGKNHPTISMIGFLAKFVYETPESTEAVCSFAIRNGITFFSPDDSVIEMAFNLKWKWEVTLYVACPNGAVSEVTFAPDSCLVITDLDPLVIKERDELFAEFPDYCSWGWNAKIIGSPLISQKSK